MPMNIDDFLDYSLQEDFKNLNNTHRSMVNAVRRVKTAADQGNLDALQQALARYEELVDKQKESLQGFKDKFPSFDLQSYLLEEFHAGFLGALAEEGLSVEAEYPVYEVLPFKVRVLPEKEMITIDDRVYRNLRPGVVARHLKKEIDKLNAASFDVQRFLQTLANAYDTEMARQVAKTKIFLCEQEVLLKDVYDNLTPMPQQKRDYPVQLFAFSLHRVLKSGQMNAPDGRRLWLGNVRNRRQALVVLDAQKQPQRYGVIKFYREG
ncbi:hypothetical protein L9W92_00135 [Pelotomaculum terephthalicicum JT]|uniref:hypothetical protein n=1 Tax=Pelotomaculum TaxID=191373 RepID=UPI0009C74B90|nr:MULTISPECIES: hypothetical protein [Pelotomaculum]MCG9966465.1 hypothetical protein [Pelotomaculum terephthalicicum JT]OPX85962.1 MAG: hypothetical protein A4E54_02117 [Pelotomaculum sp. PtaB.Bin117]OPY63394.1 MAG: hypothetical protein A4E56_00616 [Pelotomaculum sp. PtaU1.Bin065]